MVGLLVQIGADRTSIYGQLEISKIQVVQNRAIAGGRAFEPQTGQRAVGNYVAGTER